MSERKTEFPGVQDKKKQGRAGCSRSVPAHPYCYMTQALASMNPVYAPYLWQRISCLRWSHVHHDASCLPPWLCPPQQAGRGGRMAHAKRFNGEFRGRSLISRLRRRSSRQVTNLYTRPAARPRVSMQPDTHGMNGLRRLERADECSVVAGRAARPMAYVPDISGREY